MPEIKEVDEMIDLLVQKTDSDEIQWRRKLISAGIRYECNLEYDEIIVDVYAITDRVPFIEIQDGSEYTTVMLSESDLMSAIREQEQRQEKSQQGKLARNVIRSLKN